MNPVQAPGLYPEFADRYFTEQLTPTRCLTQSGIKTLLSETPADYKYGVRKQSSEMGFGAIVHALALGKGARFVVSEYDDYRTKAAREWRDEVVSAGRIPIKPEKYDEAQKIALVIQARIEQALGGAPYETEVPFFWQEWINYSGGSVPQGKIEPVATWCGGMLDVWCESLSIALDPKITGAVPSPQRAMVNFGWDLQAAWYRRGLERIFPSRAGHIRFANILVRPVEPFTSRLVTLNEGWRASAEQECQRALRIFQDCQRSGVWPGYADGIEEMDAPTWLLTQRALTEEAE